MIVLDASVLIALFGRSDAHNARSQRFFESHLLEGFVIHPLTLTEVLVGGARLGKLNQLDRDIRAMGVEVSQPDLGEPLLLAEIRSVTGLKLPDCCVLVTALQLAAPLFTFDEQLARVALSQGLTLAV